jgi:hypothetical protein
MSAGSTPITLADEGARVAPSSSLTALVAR